MRKPLIHNHYHLICCVYIKGCISICVNAHCLMLEVLRYIALNALNTVQKIKAMSKMSKIDKVKLPPWTGEQLNPENRRHSRSTVAFPLGGTRGHFIQTRVEFSHLIVLCIQCCVTATNTSIDSLDKHSIQCIVCFDLHIDSVNKQDTIHNTE